MVRAQPSMMDLLIETHIGLKRQGPGSAEMTMKALSFLGDLAAMSRVADLGCGSGGQTMVLAQNIPGTITGVDLFPDFIRVFDDSARKLSLEERVRGVVGSMDDLPFTQGEFDLIWSEGAIDNIGFEKGLTHWHGFLKKNGYIAVTCPSWLTDERPAEIDAFWSEAGSGLNGVGYYVDAMQTSGYQFVASFVLPETCWTENYFVPRETALRSLLQKYAENETVETFVAENRYEADLYSKYKQHYGYVFYIGKKSEENAS